MTISWQTLSCLSVFSPCARWRCRSRIWTRQRLFGAFWGRRLLGLPPTDYFRICGSPNIVEALPYFEFGWLFSCCSVNGDPAVVGIVPFELRNKLQVCCDTLQRLINEFVRISINITTAVINCSSICHFVSCLFGRALSSFHFRNRCSRWSCRLGLPPRDFFRISGSTDFIVALPSSELKGDILIWRHSSLLNRLLRFCLLRNHRFRQIRAFQSRRRLFGNPDGFHCCSVRWNPTYQKFP